MINLFMGFMILSELVKFERSNYNQLFVGILQEMEQCLDYLMQHSMLFTVSTLKFILFHAICFFFLFGDSNVCIIYDVDSVYKNKV